MSLRRKLIVTLVALVGAGLAISAVISYQLYSRSQYQRVDDQLRTVAPLLTDAVLRQAGSGLPPADYGPPDGDTGQPGGGQGGGPPPSSILWRR